MAERKTKRILISHSDFVNTCYHDEVIKFFRRHLSFVNDSRLKSQAFGEVWCNTLIRWGLFTQPLSGKVLRPIRLLVNVQVARRFYRTPNCLPQVRLRFYRQNVFSSGQLPNLNSLKDVKIIIKKGV